MYILLPVRYDGCHGRDAEGNGIFDNAHARITDGGVSFQDCLDIYGFCGIQDAQMPLYFISHKLGADIFCTSFVFYSCVCKACKK